MFQTHLHHFLQSFDHEALVWLMQGISNLGLRNVYLFFTFLLLFAFDFRRGVVALQCLLWASWITVWFKDLLQMPRPYAIDDSLKLYGDVEGSLRLKGQGAPTFWEGLPAANLTALREDPKLSYGFPSGHVSGAAAFWIGAGLAFGRRWLLLAAAAFVLLTMVSRMFLGMHFLTDVLGGLMIGLAVVGGMYFILLRNNQLAAWGTMQLAQWPQWLLLVVGPLLLALLPAAPVGISAQLLGLNMAVWLTCRQGFPNSRAVWWKRVLRLLIGIGLFVLTTLVVGALLKTLPGLGWLREFLHLFVAISGTTALSLRLGLFEGRLTSR